MPALKSKAAKKSNPTGQDCSHKHLLLFKPHWRKCYGLLCYDSFVINRLTRLYLSVLWESQGSFYRLGDNSRSNKNCLRSMGGHPKISKHSPDFWKIMCDVPKYVILTLFCNFLKMFLSLPIPGNISVLILCQNFLFSQNSSL